MKLPLKWVDLRWYMLNKIYTWISYLLMFSALVLLKAFSGNMENIVRGKIFLLIFMPASALVTAGILRLGGWETAVITGMAIQNETAL